MHIFEYAVLCVPHTEYAVIYGGRKCFPPSTEIFWMKLWQLKEIFKAYRVIVLFFLLSFFFSFLFAKIIVSQRLHTTATVVLIFSLLS